VSGFAPIRAPASSAENSVHLLFRELEIEDAAVLVGSAPGAPIRDGDDPELEIPSHYHLGGGLPVPARDLDDRGVVENSVRG